MRNFSLTFPLMAVLLTTSCVLTRTTTYTPKQTIDANINSNQTPTLIVLTMLSRPCLDGVEPESPEQQGPAVPSDPQSIPIGLTDVQSNRTHNAVCSQYAEMDWYPIGVLVEDKSSRTMIIEDSKLRQIAHLYLYAALNYDSKMGRKIQVVRVSTIGQYRELKKTSTFLEYQISDFRHSSNWSAAAFLLTLFVFPGYSTEQFDLNIVKHSPSMAPQQMPTTPAVEETYVSWLLFLWSLAVTEDRSQFHKYTITAPIAEIQSQDSRRRP